jgi:hypothetical protein
MTSEFVDEVIWSGSCDELQEKMALPMEVDSAILRNSSSGKHQKMIFAPI